MKGKAYFLLTVIFSGFLYLHFSCKKLDSEVIDQQYLNSGHYIQFRKRSEKEARLNSDKRNILKQLFETSFRCENMPQLVLPLVLNPARIEALQKKVPQKCSYNIGNDSPKIAVEFIGESLFHDKKLRWILLSHDKAYQDQQLAVAVYKNQNILGSREIGVFWDNISREVTSEITVKKRGNNVTISVITNKKRKYPIEQSITSTGLFEITREGKILKR